MIHPHENIPPDYRCMMHVRCEFCTMRVLSRMSLEQVDSWWEQGIISLDARDAYRHVWALSAVHSATYDHWKELPHIDARPMVKLLTYLLSKPKGDPDPQCVKANPICSGETEFYTYKRDSVKRKAGYVGVYLCDYHVRNR